MVSTAAARTGLAAAEVARSAAVRIGPADIRGRGHLAAVPRIVALQRTGAAPVVTDMAAGARTAARPIAAARMEGLTAAGDRPTQAGAASRTTRHGRLTLAARLRMGSGILSAERAAARRRAREQEGGASPIAAHRAWEAEFATLALRSRMGNGIPLAAAAAANSLGDLPQLDLRDVPVRALRPFPVRGPAALWQDAPALASVIPGLGRARLSPLPRDLAAGLALEARLAAGDSAAASVAADLALGSADAASAAGAGVVVVGGGEAGVGDSVSAGAGPVGGGVSYGVGDGRIGEFPGAIRPGVMADGILIGIPTGTIRFPTAVTLPTTTTA